MAANSESFTKTLASMESGDSLLILGGAFPGRNESAHILLGLMLIVPFLHIVTGRDEYAPRDNLLIGPEDEDPTLVELVRNDTEFGHDYSDGPNISMGRGAGLILDQTVDLVISDPMQPDAFHFVAKP